MAEEAVEVGKRPINKPLIQRLWSIRMLYVMFLPGLLYFIVFKYVPMFGVIIAFQEYSPFKGMLHSDWVGLKHFEDLFGDPYFYTLLKNTFVLAIYTLLFGFPVPIVFALLLNELRMMLMKRFIQTVTFFPYFISSAVAVGILYTFLSPQSGFVNIILEKAFGIDPISFMAEPGYFRSLYVGLEIWRSFGYGAIIYLAAIAGIDPHLYEAADVDGASRLGKMMHVTLPGIRHTMIILLILGLGSALTVSLDTILLMYNPSVYSKADVLQTYVFRRGFGIDTVPNYSFASAAGLFQSVVALILIGSANAAAKRFSETRLF
ncbi:putative multiple-sugar transport system permease YteP [compost metagenome]